jgi:hypothetical protein
MNLVERIQEQMQIHLLQTEIDLQHYAFAKSMF